MKWHTPCRIFFINLLQHLGEQDENQDLWWWWGGGDGEKGHLGSWLFFVSKWTVQFDEGKKKTAKASSSSSLSLLFVSYLLLLLLTLEVVKPWPVHSWSCSAQVWVHVVFQDGSAWTGHRVCWGWRSFATLHAGRMWATHRPYGHANPACGGCLHPSVLTSVGLFISHFVGVLQKRASEHVF